MTLLSVTRSVTVAGSRNGCRVTGTSRQPLLQPTRRAASSTKVPLCHANRHIIILINDSDMHHPIHSCRIHLHTMSSGSQIDISTVFDTRVSGQLGPRFRQVLLMDNVEICFCNIYCKITFLTYLVSSLHKLKELIYVTRFCTV